MRAADAFSPAARRQSRRRAGAVAFRYGAGAVLGAAALYACVRRLQPDQLAESLRATSGAWVVAAVASVFVTLTLVTIRWGVLVAPDGGSSRWRSLWHSVILGQAVNILVPLRFGEGTRVIVTARRLGLTIGRVVAAAALERLFDVAAFTAAVVLFLVAGLLPAKIAAGAPLAAMFAVLTMAVLLGFLYFVRWLARRAPRDGSPRILGWLRDQGEAVAAGWSESTTRRRLVAASGLTAVILLSSAMTNLLVFRAFHLAVPAPVAVILLVVLQIGTAVVSVPGNIGVFHYLTVLTLAQWQVPAPQALAAAIVLHAVSIGPKILLAPLALIDRPADA
jgi:uncharacterized membrane protein YbhN (UPF0104 family)